jgi:hypothetical protein
MIIGTSAALRELASDLVEQVEKPPSSPTSGWPPHLLTLNAESPYRDVAGYTVSFHLELEPLATRFSVKRRNAPNAVVFWATSALALLGLTSLVRWIARAA